MCYYELYVPGTIIDVDVSSSLCCVACFGLRTIDVRDNNTGGHQFITRVGRDVTYVVWT